MKMRLLFLAATFFTVGAGADATLDAAIGGGLGGAAGAAIGNEIGGREGAIAGGALGAATGTAITTDKYPERRYPPTRTYVVPAPPPAWVPPGYHCPPGQRKKGRC
jgi:hypothetical protein